MNTLVELEPAISAAEIVQNVFSTMLGFTVAPRPPGNLKPADDRVSGTVGLAGESITGAIYVHLPEPFARSIVNGMLGSPLEQEVSDDELHDVVGELTNMIGGGFKSALCDGGRPCAMSTPAIIRGVFAIEVPQDLQVHNFPFDCQGTPFSVEVHLKSS